MRVDDDVRGDARARERQIFRAHHEAADAFLAVHRAEFVALLRDARLPRLRAREGALDEHARDVHAVVGFVQRTLEDGVLRLHGVAEVELAVVRRRAVPQELIVAEHAEVERAFRENERVFLIVAAVAEHGDDDVLAADHGDALLCGRLKQRPLRVPEALRGPARRRHPHDRLLDHLRHVHRPRRLVVLDVGQRRGDESEMRVVADVFVGGEPLHERVDEPHASRRS